MSSPLPLSNTTLYYRDGGSDKIYQCAIVEAPGGFLVNFAFGRRGSSLQTGTKTTLAVPLDKAQKIHAKLIQEKTSKGYTPGADGTPYTATDKKTTGYLPQLLNAISEKEANNCLTDNNYCAQEKKDGERMILAKQDSLLIAANKKGLNKAIPETIVEDMKRLPLLVTLDGEIIGDHYYVFDLLELQCADLRSQPYEERYNQLLNIFGPIKTTYLHLVGAVFSTKTKQALFTQLMAENREGIVFKKARDPYVSGRPASGGSQLKYKFYATASVIVTAVNDKRSVGLSVYRSDQLVGIGNVTVPVNQTIPEIGNIIEVRYLYFYDGGSLFQPVLLGVRTDVDANECLYSQLKIKAE